MSDTADSAIVQPQHTTAHRRRIAERVMLLPLRPHLQAFLARGGYDRRARRTRPSWCYYPPPTPDKPGVAGPFVGAPHATIVLEESIALGAREIVFFGIAGALGEAAKVGEILLVESAYADEGTSPHYQPERRVFSAAPELMRKLERKFSMAGQPLRRVSGWTTDALYRETPDKLRRRIAEGRAIVEMELSALYCVAEVRGVQAAGVVVVSDALHESGWRPAFYTPRFRRSVATAIKILAQE